MKAKQFIILSIMALSMVMFIGCFESRCIEGNYHTITETRNISSFTEVTSEGDYTVNIVNSPMYSIEVKAEENLLPYISTYVHGSTLTISTRDARCFRENYPVVVTVYAPSVESVNLKGSGQITCDSLKTSSVWINLSGSGDIDAGVWSHYLHAEIAGSGEIRLNGNNSESDMLISGSGNIRAYNLQQDSCFATISGSGDMYLWVNDLLDVKITGSGSVNYVGNPGVSTSISGSGKVIHH